MGNYSLGMRQRLGIAAALIGDPSVLILDEPANGLDPAGIRWMRDLLRDYADHGGTVLLSSHLLAEIEIIADDIVMIGQGRIVCQGSKAELLAAAGTVVRAADVVALQRALAAAGVASTVSEDGSLRTDADTALVGRAAYDGGVVLTELRNADSGGLEEMFLELTADTQREEDSGMTATDQSTRSAPVDVPRSRTSRSAGSSASSSARCSTPGPGFWLIASIAITGLIATIATIAFAPDQDLTYYNFAKAVGFPITVILPMVALLSITSEWSQRSGLTTFTYVPNRRRVVWAKTLSSVIVAVASMLFAFAIGAVGNVVGSSHRRYADGLGPLGRPRPHDRAGQPDLPARPAPCSACCCAARRAGW